MKRIISLIILTAILTTSVLSFSSCEKPEIYNLIEMLLDNKQDGSVYNLDAELNIKINKSYLYRSGILPDFRNADFDAVPDEMNLKLSGDIQHVKNNKICNAQISIEMDELKNTIYLLDSALYIANNELTKIILDLLTATGFVDFPVKEIFADIAYADSGKLFYVDLKDFDISWFEQYSSHIEKTFTISSKSKLEIYRGGNPFPRKDFNAETLLNFDNIKSQVKKELLKFEGYRYAELSVIISSDNYIHILASRENGERELLEPVKSDIGMRAAIAKINREPAALWTENIIPMRYILELLGEDVNWDNAAKKPYIVRKGENVHFKAAIINSRSYINLTQILSTAAYAVSTGEIGDYIEFKIMRQYLP